MAALGQAAAQVPQPLHSTSLMTGLLLLFVEADGVDTGRGCCRPAAGAGSSSTSLVAASTSISPRPISDSAWAAAAEACATVSGMSFGPWQAPAMKTPSVACRDRGELGVLLHEEAVRAAADAEERARPPPRPRPARGRCTGPPCRPGRAAPARAACPPPGPPACPSSVSSSGEVGDRGRLAADEADALLEQAVVELLVALPEAAHVDVEVVDLRAGLLLDRGGRTSARTCSRRASSTCCASRRGCRRSG